MAYSVDFRKKVLSIRTKEKLSVEATAKRFHIGEASIFRWLKKVDPCRKRNKPATKIKKETLKKDVENYPDAYNYERAKRLKVSTSGIFWALKRLGVTYKKNVEASQGRRRKASCL